MAILGTRTIDFTRRLLLCWLVVAAGSAFSQTSPDQSVPALDATSENAGQALSLAGKWQFRPGDDPAWAQPEYDDSDWDKRAVPALWPQGGYPESGQMAWYRLRLQLFPEGNNGEPERLSVALGKVLSAYQLYAGGQLLGGVGGMPPGQVVEYDKLRIYPVPASAIGPDGELVLALRVWGGDPALVEAWGAGPYEGEFLLGEYRELMMATVMSETGAMLFSSFFIGFGIYHLYLYSRNRQLRSFFWFGLMAVNIGIYGLMLSQWKYSLGLPFLAYKKIEFGAIYLFPALGLQVVWALLNHTVSPILRLYQLSFVAASIAVVVTPGMAIHYQTLGAWQVWTLPALVLGPWQVARRAMEGNREALTLLVGLLIFVATCINDLLIDWMPLQTPRLMPFGFAAIMLFMAVSLADRFTAMLNQLEREVAQRTDELQAANEYLAVAARNDTLTGLLNRRGFTEEADLEIQRGHRSGRSFAVVLADVDRFKDFNDRFGHSCGDQVLQQVAGLLKRRTRDVDCVARWGGEEFILMLPEAELEGAVVLAEDLRAAIEGTEFEYEGRPLSITMTFGIAVYRKGESLQGCINRADTALYEGKELGRNTVMVGNYKGLTLVT